MLMLLVKINAGTSIGFVGPSGCGKSTIFKLILRFYDVTSGAILVDGTDLRQFSLKSWLENIAVVTQEPVLFTGTVKQSKHEIIEGKKRKKAKWFLTFLTY